MLRKTLIAMLLVVSSAAVANGPTRQGISGAGILTNADGQQAHFGIQAVKIIHRNNAHVAGNFRFVAANRDASTAVTITTTIRRLHVQDNTAEFAGEGLLTVRQGRQVRHFAGRLSGFAQDLRLPNDTENPDADTLRFVFEPRAQGAETFAFDGTVTQGDIFIAARN
ncbi:MAG: hypothetical protein RMJ43_12675 [Chloroherpetonaceae bacterium]|nr:hypothetical protein [Chthonomonadaceae bacterium]MDW8208684.1 hypothetical protein [Chloroherpetonaceae bacterium]